MKMIKYHVWKRSAARELKKGDHAIATTWAMKKKSNGTFRARMNARGFEQKYGEHYFEDDKAALVLCDIIIRMVFYVGKELYLIPDFES